MTIADQGTDLSLTLLSPTVGAVVEDIDLANDLSESLVASLRGALLQHKVIFFRDQHLTTEQHLALGRAFGELEVHPFAYPDPHHAEMLRIHHSEDSPGTENVWHSDVTWRLAPSLGSLLYLTEVPPVGGDTLFADMAAAYDGLTDEIRERIDGQVARHDFAGFRRRLESQGASEEKLAEFDAAYPHPRHPVVRTHPETGRRSIYVNTAFTREIVGWDPDESREMLRYLYQQASHPEYQCRFRWETNSLAFWDNRAVQHYAVSDYFPSARTARRVTVIGDVPYFNPDQPVLIADERPFRGQTERNASRGAPR